MNVQTKPAKAADKAIRQISDAEFEDLMLRAKSALDKAEPVKIAVERIRPYLDQPRHYFEPQSIRELSNSICVAGQLQPGIVRKKSGDAYSILDIRTDIQRRKVRGTSDYELAAGERRWRAIWLIPEDVRPLYEARLIEADDQLMHYLVSSIDNAGRENLGPLECCDSIQRYVAEGFSYKQIAVILSISAPAVAQYYKLRNLHPDLKKLINPALERSERLPLMAAYEIADSKPESQLELAERVLNQDLRAVNIKSVISRQQTGARGQSSATAGMPRLSTVFNAFRGLLESAEILHELLSNADRRALVDKAFENPADAQTFAFQLSEAAKKIVQCNNRMPKSAKTKI